MWVMTLSRAWSPHVPSVLLLGQPDSGPTHTARALLQAGGTAAAPRPRSRPNLDFGPHGGTGTSRTLRARTPETLGPPRPPLFADEGNRTWPRRRPSWHQTRSPQSSRGDCAEEDLLRQVRPSGT